MFYWLVLDILTQISIPSVYKSRYSNSDFDDHVINHISINANYIQNSNSTNPILRVLFCDCNDYRNLVCQIYSPRLVTE